MDEVTCIVLAGGLGSRLSPIIGADTPKVLANVNGRPFLESLLEFLSRKGFSDVIFSLGHLSERVKDNLAKTASLLPVRIVEEDSPLGTGGAVVLASKETDREYVLVLNGDTIVDFDMDSLMALMSGDTKAVLGLSRKSGSDTAAKFFLEAGKVGLVNGEKVDPNQFLTHAGVTLIRRSELQAFCATSAPFGLETAVLAGLVSAGTVAGVEIGDFLDFGTPGEYSKVV